MKTYLYASLLFVLGIAVICLYIVSLNHTATEIINYFWYLLALIIMISLYLLKETVTNPHSFRHPRLRRVIKISYITIALAMVGYMVYEAATSPGQDYYGGDVKAIKKLQD